MSKRRDWHMAGCPINWRGKLDPPCICDGIEQKLASTTLDAAERVRDWYENRIMPGIIRGEIPAPGIPDRAKLAEIIAIVRAERIAAKHTTTPAEGGPSIDLGIPESVAPQDVSAPSWHAEVCEPLGVSAWHSGRPWKDAPDKSHHWHPDGYACVRCKREALLDAAKELKDLAARPSWVGPNLDAFRAGIRHAAGILELRD